MYMHITLTSGTTKVEFCADGSYHVNDGVLHIQTNRYTGEAVHYPLVNILKYELKRTDAAPPSPAPPRPSPEHTS